MEQFTVEPWAAVLQLGVFFASIVMWLQIAAWWRRRATILEFEPRSPVPWGAVAILPALAFMFLALLPEPATDAPPPKELVQDPWDAAQHLVAAILLQAMMAGLVVGIAVLSQSSLRDLGIVPTPRQIARDVGTGVAAFLAVAAPVHFVQALMIYLMGQQELSNNPLIKMVTSGEPQLGVFVLATIAAVVVAPICEEVLYRLVLQGWLEKWEDERLGWREPAVLSQFEGDDLGVAVDSPVTESNSVSTAEANPPMRGVAGLPYGWLPILISSALFAAAHYGYGPEPVPIFLLAIILGYVYQRTHRIIPCIVAHSLFNALTMITLWGLKLKE
jgi:membrane protease YdiL (CAAX protease family)